MSVARASARQSADEVGVAAGGRTPPARRAATWRPWTGLAAFALGLTLVDMFWAVSLEGAVGAVERAAGPLVTWVVQCVLTFPLFVAAMYAVCRSRARRAAAVGLLTVLAGTATGLVVVAAQSAWDYRTQAAQIELVHATHEVGRSPASPGAAVLPAAVPQPQPQLDGCDTVCRTKRETVAVHVRAFGYAAVVLLVSNVVVVGWVAAMRGGRVPELGRATA